MKTLFLVLVVSSLILSQTFVSNKSEMTTDPSVPGVVSYDETTIVITKNSIKMYNDKGKLWRTFYPASGYTFGFRDWACPAWFNDYEHANILLVKKEYTEGIIINYPHVGNMSVFYTGYYK